MNKFDLLLIGHLIGDFLFQTSWMASNKSENWIALLSHVTIYTTVIVLVSWQFGGLSILGITIIFIGHVVLDRQKFVTFWVSKIQKADEKNTRWLSIMTDQIFHVVLLALAIYLT